MPKTKDKQSGEPLDPAKVAAVMQFLKEKGVDGLGIDLEQLIRKADESIKRRAILAFWPWLAFMALPIWFYMREYRNYLASAGDLLVLLLLVFWPWLAFMALPIWACMRGSLLVPLLLWGWILLCGEVFRWLYGVWMPRYVGQGIWKQSVPVPYLGRKIIRMLRHRPNNPVLPDRMEPAPLNHDVFLGDDGELIDVTQEQKGGSETRQ